MARLAWLLGAWGLAAEGSLATALPDDGLALVQLAQAVSWEWEVPGGLPQEPGYENENFAGGELVEVKAKDGTWHPGLVKGRGDVSGVWDVHISEDFPGYNLRNVPYSLVRRPLVSGEADYYVNNGWLRHKGKGMRFRYSKNLSNTAPETAGWGSLVSGHDEGDGWLKVSGRYLPMGLNGIPVLVKLDRAGTSTFPSAAQLANLSVPKGPVFLVGEHSEYRSILGDWYPCKISAPGSVPGTYNIMVNPSESAMFPVTNAGIERLKKMGPTIAHRTPSSTAPEVKAPMGTGPSEAVSPGAKLTLDTAANVEPPLCRKDGCISVRVRNEEGREFMLQVSKTARLDMMMKMVCNKLKLEWDTCQTKHTFEHDGNQLQPWTHITLSGLRDQDLVEMKEQGAQPSLAPNSTRIA